MLSNKTIIVGVTGGIAAYKACDVVSKLKKLNANIHVIMTESACEFVQPMTFQTLSNNFFSWASLWANSLASISSSVSSL